MQGEALQVRQQPGTIPWLIVAVHSNRRPGRLSPVDIVGAPIPRAVPPQLPVATPPMQQPKCDPYSATYSFFDTKK